MTHKSGGPGGAYGLGEVVSGDRRYGPPTHPIPSSVKIPFDRGRWTDLTKDALRFLWDAGYSTAPIGHYLGFSKNAIVGKAHRLGLPTRPSPIKRDGNAPKRTAPPRVTGPTLPPFASEAGIKAPPPRKLGDWITPERDEILKRWWPTYKPRIEILRIMAEAPGPLWPNVGAVKAYARRTLGVKRPDDLNSVNRPLKAIALPERHSAPRRKPVASEPTIRLIQTYARITGCCFPIGEVGTPTFRFCDVPHRNRSYCAEHEAIAYLRGRRDTGSFAITAETRSSFLFGDMG